MVHLILTGATGLVGASVLSHILSLPPTSKPVIDKVTILTRSTSITWLSNHPPAGTPNINKHTKIEVINHNDFTSYPPQLLERLKSADACIWSLGVSMNAVSKDEYIKITKDYALAAAKAFSSLRNSPPNISDSSAAYTRKFKFIYISGEGATQHPRPWTALYGRIKGETEQALLELAKTNEYSSLLSVYSVRPMAVDGQNQPWIWDFILNTKRTAFQRFYLKTLLVPMRWSLWERTILSPTEQLGKVLVEMVVSEHRGPFEVGDGVDPESKGRTLGNKRLRMMEDGQGWWK